MKNCTIGAVDRQECSLINHSFGGFTMVRFMGRSLLLALVLSISAVSAQAQYGRYGGWGGWGGGVGTAQGSMMRGAGVAAAGAGAYNEQTAVARSINANTAMQVNQYMYEVNKTNAKYYYTRSANKQKEESSTGEAIYNRLHDNPSGYDIHTGDALNVVLDELTNPAVYTQVVTGATRPIDSDLVKNIEFSYAANMIAISLADFSARGVPDYLLTTPDFAPDRAAIKALVGKVRNEIDSKGQASAETLAECRVAINALKAKVDSLEPQGTRNRTEADNYLKALYGLSKMLETPSVDQFLTGLKKGDTTTIGHLIAFMHTFNLRFGAAKTPVQEQTYDQLYPLLVAVRDQGKVPSANPYTTSSGPQDPKAVSAYFSGMQYDPKHGVVPPPPPPPSQP
jgi:hypothetical protein